jgi:hypothetical protein
MQPHRIWGWRGGGGLKYKHQLDDYLKEGNLSRNE